MARRYPCPQCGREMLLERVHEGFEVPCPACGHRFLVPIGAVGEAATAEAPSAVRTPTDAAAAATAATAAPMGSIPPATPGRIPDPPRSGGGAVDDGTTAMIVGILGIVICQFLSPVAWYLGNKVREEARRTGREPPGAATAGWILGIVGSVLMILGLAFACLYGAVVMSFLRAGR